VAAVVPDRRTDTQAGKTAYGVSKVDPVSRARLTRSAWALVEGVDPVLRRIKGMFGAFSVGKMPDGSTCRHVSTTSDSGKSEFFGLGPLPVVGVHHASFRLTDATIPEDDICRTNGGWRATRPANV
jgi:hypothetical protein